MKRYLLFIALIFCVNSVYAVTNSYIQRYPVLIQNPYSYRPVYNPYSTYQNPYLRYRRVNSNNLKRIRRIQRIRNLNRLKRNFYPYLTWLGKNNTQGALTGYSMPISSDIYKQMGITPYNKNPRKQVNSINCDTDLFSTPQGNEMYYKNGKQYKDIQGSSGKTGVTIIYD